MMKFESSNFVLIALRYFDVRWLMNTSAMQPLKESLYNKNFLHWENVQNYLTVHKWMWIRGCSPDTGMTFIPERVHSIPIYFSVSVYMIPRRKLGPAQVIPVFNPNEILVLVWHFILVSCKLKTNSVPRWKRKPCSLGRVAHAYRFQDGAQNGRFQDGWVGRFCHVNAVRTSFWNETHSGMKLILVSCEQPLM